MRELRTDVSRLVKIVGEFAESALLHEFKVKTHSIDYHFHNVQELTLKFMTSIMAVEGQLHVLFAFSFDKPLIEKITKEYTSDIQSKNSNQASLIPETAADTINLILGNSLQDFAISGKAIELTPPVVLSEAKTIYRNKNAQFVTASLNTELGEMQVYCIGPKQLFDSELNYIKESL